MPLPILPRHGGAKTRKVKKSSKPKAPALIGSIGNMYIPFDTVSEGCFYVLFSLVGFYHKPIKKLNFYRFLS